MELITEIYDKHIGLEPSEQQLLYFVRKASRAIIFNNQQEIALLYSTKNTFHKLPGGGFENEESVTDTLRREVMEEVGAAVTNIKELGLIIENRTRQHLYTNLENHFLQFSYCFTCELDGIVTNPSLTEAEEAEGLQIKWVSLNKALELVKQDQPKNYQGKFIQQRDYAFLQKAYEQMKKESV